MLADRALEERQAQPFILGMADYLRACWDVAQQAKKPIAFEYKLELAMDNLLTIVSKRINA